LCFQQWISKHRTSKGYLTPSVQGNLLFNTVYLKPTSCTGLCTLKYTII
jgi:hypothetical protein